MEVLTNDDHKEIISWLAHGKGFMIFQTKEFVANVMPKYFKQTKFPSFTRKLSRWGFKRVQRGPEVGVYYHDLFNRDKPNLCRHMQSHKGAEGKMLKRDTKGLSHRLEKLDEMNCTLPQSVSRTSSIGSEKGRRHELVSRDVPQREVQPLSYGNTFNETFSAVQKRSLELKESFDRNNQISHHYDRSPIGVQAAKSPVEISTSAWLELARQNEQKNNIRSATPCYTNTDVHHAAHIGSQLFNVPKPIASNDQIRLLLLQNILLSQDRNQQTYPQSTPCSNVVNTSLRPHQNSAILIQSALQQIGLNSDLCLN